MWYCIMCVVCVMVATQISAQSVKITNDANTQGNKTLAQDGKEAIRYTNQALPQYNNEKPLQDQSQDVKDSCIALYSETFNIILANRTRNVAECMRFLRGVKSVEENNNKRKECEKETKNKIVNQAGDRTNLTENTASLDVLLKMVFSPPPSKNQGSHCNPIYPDKPNFSAFRKRISEIKCMEYIWTTKRNKDEEDNDVKCAAENNEYYFLGRPAGSGEFPHMGAVGWLGLNGKWLYKCGSSLISPKFVLTAAHCSKASALITDLADLVPKIVRFGSIDLFEQFAGYDEKEVFHNANIIRIFVHPHYKPPKKYFDIALMELDHELGFSLFLHPACLWTSPDSSSGGIISSAGWGAVSETSQEISPVLRTGELNIIETKQCHSLLSKKFARNWCGLLEHQICAGILAGGVDACYGDSGGPLQVSLTDKSSIYKIHNVIGLTAFGFGCGRKNMPGVYTRVSSFIDWLEPIVWPSSS